MGLSRPYPMRTLHRATAGLHDLTRPSRRGSANEVGGADAMQIVHDGPGRGVGLNLPRAMMLA